MSLTNVTGIYLHPKKPFARGNVKRYCYNVIVNGFGTIHTVEGEQAAQVARDAAAKEQS